MAGTSRIRAGRAFVEMSADDSKLQRALKRAERRLQNFGRSVSSVGQSIRGIGMGLGAAAASIAAPLAYSLKTFSGFADKMSQVRAVTQATDADFQRLQKRAEELGASTSFSASQVADGMVFLGMAGFNTEQILAGIPAVLNLARAGAIELGEAADIASDVGSAFGLAADEIGRIADVMATTASSANTSVSMMGETFKYVAPLAAAAGQSLEDTATAIGVLGNSGIKASTAGTDLALILNTMADSKGAEKMRALGVAVSDASGNMRSAKDVMTDLGAATEQMTQQDRLALFSQLFGRAAKSALTLSTAGEGLDALSAKINNSAGAAEKMAAQMDDNLGGSFRQLMSAAEGVQIAIGKALEGPVRSVLGMMAKAAGAVQQFISANKELVVTIAKWTAIGAAVAAVITTVGVALAGVGFIISGVGAAIGAVASVVGFLLSPIGLIIAGVALATAAIVGGVAAWMAFTDSGKKAASVLGSSLKAIGKVIGKVFGGIKDAFMAGDLKLAAEIAMGGLLVGLQAALAPIERLWARTWGGFKKIVKGIGYDLLAVWEIVCNGVRGAWEETWNWVGRMAATVIENIKKAWAGVANWFAETWIGVLHVGQFIDDDEAMDRMGKLQNEHRSTLGQYTDEGNRVREELNRQREAKREKRQLEYETNMSAISEAHKRELEAIDKQTDLSAEEAKAKLAVANRRLSDSIEKARRAREEANAEDDAELGTGTAGSWGSSNMAANRSAIDNALSSASMGTASAQGTFSSHRLNAVFARDDNSAPQQRQKQIDEMRELRRSVDKFSTEARRFFAGYSVFS